MPFAPNAGGVALRRQQLRNGDLPQRQSVRPATDRDFVGPGADGEAAGHEGRAGRRALRFDIEVEQAHAFAGERVDARGGRAPENAASIGAEFAIAEVVREHEDNIRLLVRHLGRSQSSAEHQCRSHRGEAREPISSRRCHGRRSVYWNAKMRFQSFFISTTVHLFSLAASNALSRRPKWDWRSYAYSRSASVW